MSDEIPVDSICLIIQLSFFRPTGALGEALVPVAATSVKPIDSNRRAGLTKDFYPINFPGLMGVDVAGTFVMVGSPEWKAFPRRQGVYNGG